MLVCAMARDPLCKMNVDEKQATKIKHNDKNYYFCGSKCQKAFEKNPERYVCAECGKDYDIKKTVHKFRHEGKLYVFCSNEHKKKYQIKHFKQVIY